MNGLRQLPSHLDFEGDDEEDEGGILGESDSSEEEDEGFGDSSSSDDGESKNKKPATRSKASTKTRRTFVGDEDVRAEGDISSDEEHERNTIGNVPLRWYDEFDHIGYDKAGKKLVKKDDGMDEVDRFLASKDDPFYRRTVYDAKNDTSTVLTDRELVMVKRMLESKFPEVGFNAESEYVDYFTGEKEIMPLHSTHEPKRRFVPSKWERMKVMKIVRGIKEGRISMGKPPAKQKPEVHLLWGEDDQIEDSKRRRGPRHIPAPRVELPDHRESYHPPPEYLPNEDEIKEWQEAHPDDRKLNYLPTDYGQLRKVPRYPGFIAERFERCLDLYLCPRKEKNRLDIDPESLVPKLPRPSELKPYPNVLGVTYFGHTSRVRALSVSPCGSLLASGGDDEIVKIWEVDTGRCLATYDLGSRDTRGKEAITCLAWNPQAYYHVLAVGVGKRVVLVNTAVGNCISTSHAEETHKMLKGKLASQIEEAEQAKSNGDAEEEDDDDEGEKVTKKSIQEQSREIADWVEDGDFDTPSSLMDGDCFAKTTIQFKEVNNNDVMDLAWHAKGEYLATVCNAMSASAQVTVHHICRRTSQRPFTMTKNQTVQKVLFHPKKPILFVATKQFVNVYHLLRQRRLRQLKSSALWISSMALHPEGDNLVISTYDRRVSWFDLDISHRPWKTLKYHKKAVRKVSFHSRYPLLASAADDGAVHIFHARIFEDLGKDPFLVPVKILKGHMPTIDGLGVLDIAFHPTQPWIFSAGADGRVQLYQNI